MTKKQFRTRLRLLIVLTLILFSLIGFAAGKYMQTHSFEGTVTFTARLAGNMVLQESTAENNYVLIPGVDISKDPYIVITEKTAIPAYLFLVVDDGLAGTGITYTPESHWVQVTGQTNVYVYSGANGPIVIDNDTEGLDKIMILAKNDAGNSIIVSQNLKKDATFNLKFSAVLKETYKVTVDDGEQWETPATIYGNQ